MAQLPSMCSKARFRFPSVVPLPGASRSATGSAGGSNAACDTGWSHPDCSSAGLGVPASDPLLSDELLPLVDTWYATRAAIRICTQRFVREVYKPTVEMLRLEGWGAQARPQRELSRSCRIRLTPFLNNAREE